MRFQDEISRQDFETRKELKELKELSPQTAVAEIDLLEIDHSIVLEYSFRECSEVIVAH